MSLSEINTLVFLYTYFRQWKYHIGNTSLKGSAPSIINMVNLQKEYHLTVNMLMTAVCDVLFKDDVTPYITLFVKQKDL